MESASSPKQEGRKIGDSRDIEVICRRVECALDLVLSTEPQVEMKIKRVRQILDTLERTETTH